MSISPPLFANQFWERIRFAGRPEFELLQYRKQSMDNAGNMLSNRGGSPKWHADVRTSNGRHDADQEVQALLKVLMGRDAAFYAYDIRKAYPSCDKDGSLLAGSGLTPTVRSVGGDNRSLALDDLPGRYFFLPGEMISINGTGGKWALLEICEAIDVTANHTPVFEVQPFLPTWIAEGQEVDVIKPRSKFKVVAGSYKAQDGSGNQSSGISFSMISVP